jgi:hypothetical protein
MASPIHSIEKKSDICEATNDWIGYPFVINRVVDGIPAWAEKSEDALRRYLLPNIAHCRSEELVENQFLTACIRASLSKGFENFSLLALLHDCT